MIKPASNKTKPLPLVIATVGNTDFLTKTEEKTLTIVIASGVHLINNGEMFISGCSRKDYEGSRGWRK